MIATWMADLPHGMRLSCRSAGERGRPLMLFLHGFPEGAFVWDRLMEHFAQPEHGGFRCVAPNLRGFERSSAPAEVEAYKPALLIADIMALAAQEGQHGRIDTLVAHDWGGALAWGAAHAGADRIERLVIINAPHAATFARELRRNPEQQNASQYMHFLSRPDAEKLLSENDYQRLWSMLEAGRNGADWLSASVRQQYREVWDCGLTGACNLYRVTPLKPPRPGVLPVSAIPELSPEQTGVKLPTLVLWAMSDIALHPALLDGLAQYVPDLEVHEIPGATHWVVHEQPEHIAEKIEAFANR